MLRIFRLTLCCLLVGMADTQADTYPVRDDGFNPMNMMQDMFDSSDRRYDSRHRRRPPPPRFPPRHRYPRPPVYGAPAGAYPTRKIGPPGHAVHPDRTAGASAERPPVVDQSVDSDPNREAGGSVATTESAVHSPRAGSTPIQGYSFRPMTPLPYPQTEAPAVSAGDDSASIRQETASEPDRSAPTPGRTIPAPTRDTTEPIMVNGQPAVFRPLELGPVDTD